MPPRKRQRVSHATSPAPPEASSPTPAAEGAAATTSKPSPPTTTALLNDPWTDEEEIGLFKGLIHWKPSGIHKHFRMLQLRNSMLDGGYVTEEAAHTRIPGIWEKLNGLYDLEALDQREDARQLDDVPALTEWARAGEEGQAGKAEGEDDEEEEDDVYSLAENKIMNNDYGDVLDGFLDDEGTDWAQRKWERRLLSKKERKAESPPGSDGVMVELNLMEAAPVRFETSRRTDSEVVSESVEEEDQEEDRRAGARRGKPIGRSRKVAGEESEKAKSTPATRGRGRGRGGGMTSRRSARQAGSASVADTETPDKSDSGEEDNGESGEEEEDDESGSEDQEESEANSTPAPRASRTGRGGRGGAGARGRGGASTRGKKRGRGRR